MKHTLLLITLLVASLRLCAQEAMSADTLHIDATAQGDDKPWLQPEGVKSFGGFLLDMRNLMPQRVVLPGKVELYDASKDYSAIFRLNPDVTYSSGLSGLFTGHGWWYGSPYGMAGYWPGDVRDNLQMGSFKLRNGWRLNTYGQYDKDGWKVPNPSALPWERNNFKGAFELKSQDGSFGIRIQVERGCQSPFY